ncbi:MAG: hypothetical protein QW416_08620 [Candidatus Nitrosocaldaceae archaeon]
MLFNILLDYCIDWNAYNELDRRGYLKIHVDIRSKRILALDITTEEATL